MSKICLFCEKAEATSELKLMVRNKGITRVETCHLCPGCAKEAIKKLGHLRKITRALNGNDDARAKDPFAGLEAADEEMNQEKAALADRLDRDFEATRKEVEASLNKGMKLRNYDDGGEAA